MVEISPESIVLLTHLVHVNSSYLVDHKCWMCHLNTSNKLSQPPAQWSTSLIATVLGGLSHADVEYDRYVFFITIPDYSRSVNYVEPSP